MAATGVLAVGALSGCTSTDPAVEQTQVAACAAFAAEPDVPALTAEADAIVVGDFRESSPSSADVTVDRVLKGSPVEGTTVSLTWDDACGSPADFLETPPAEGEGNYVYFLIEQSGEFGLVEGSYGMFEASDELLAQVDDALGS